MKHSRIACALLAGALLAACGGNGSSSSSSPIVPQAKASAPAATPTSPTDGGSRIHHPGPFRVVRCHAMKGHKGRCVRSTANVTFYEVARTSPDPTPTPRNGIFARRPHFVSPSTNGLTWVAYLHGTQTIAASGIDDVAAGSSICTSSSPRTCSVPLTVDGSVSGISYDFVMELWDEAPNGQGNIPAAANELGVSHLTTTVYVNQANNFSFLVNGIWVTTNPTSGGAAFTYQSLPGDGSTHNFPVVVQALDADGNIITGPNPYASPVPITLTETGGSGFTTLVVNGSGSGSSGSLTKPADTLALQYDGLGSVGYSTSTNMGGSVVTVSPMYLTPTSATSVKLSDTHTTTVTEKNAPAGIAYSSSLGTCASTVARSIAGSGASAVVTMNSTAPPDTAQTCNVTVTDILGTQMVFPIAFTVPGPIGVPGTPTFPTGGSGTCGGANAIAFTGTGQTAIVTLTDPLYTGTLTGGSSATSIATVSISGSGASETATVTAGVAGTATLTFTDTAGNSFTCSIGVTTSGGSVS